MCVPYSKLSAGVDLVSVVVPRVVEVVANTRIVIYQLFIRYSFANTRIVIYLLFIRYSFANTRRVIYLLLIGYSFANTKIIIYLLSIGYSFALWSRLWQTL